MTGQIECRYYGRAFTIEEMALLRALIAGPAQFTRHALSKGVWVWYGKSTSLI